MGSRALSIGIVGIVCASCGSSGGSSGGAGDLALVSYQPANGESAVPRNRAIRMLFSEPVDPESVHDESILVRVGVGFQTRPAGQFQVTGDTVVFDPGLTESGLGHAIGFDAGQQVRVTVPLKQAGDGQPAARFVRSLGGKVVTVVSGGPVFTFLTGDEWNDPVPGRPEMVGLDFAPVPDQSGRVAPYAAVTVVFSEPVDPSTFALGKNIFLTNNSPGAPAGIYQKDIPCAVFYDGSLTRYTLQPVFGFGEGPYTIRVGFLDPDATTFYIDNPPRDLAGNPLDNTLLTEDFDTLADPIAVNYGVLSEDFLTTSHRDDAFTDALWGNDAQLLHALAGKPITKRVQRVNFAAITTVSGGMTAIDNAPTGLGEEDYCPTQNPLIGSDSIVNFPDPPASAGRRQLNLYRRAELGARGTVVRVAWGPDSDATFAATYPAVTIRMGHHKAGTDLVKGATMFDQYDVDGYVTLVDKKSYTVPQRFDVNGGSTNDGYLDWPQLDAFFDYDGTNDVILDVESQMGNTFQTFRTFLAVSAVGVGAVCKCTVFFNCPTNTSIGKRQMDGVYGGNVANPVSGPGYVIINPSTLVNVMEFEIATLRSDARSLYYDSATQAPDYMTPILRPLVQPGGATVALTWSASHDGIVEDVPFTTDVNACDGYRYLRWNAVMHGNLFTNARPRLDLLQIPYVIP
jgi:hypothetical protein